MFRVLIDVISHVIPPAICLFPKSPRSKLGTPMVTVELTKEPREKCRRCLILKFKTLWALGNMKDSDAHIRLAI